MNRKLPRPEHPRPDFRRDRWLNLNGEWDFGSGDVEKFDRRIVVPFGPQSQLSGLGVQPDDVVWYRRTFDAPRAQRLLLRFGAVDYRATVWVNGEEVGAHEGGHAPFACDITRVAKPRDNVVVVRAEDPLADRAIPRGKQYWGTRPESIFYTPTTGIWQTVWLEPLPEPRVESIRITPDFDGRSVDVEVDAGGQIRLTVSLDDSVIARWEGRGRRARIELPQFRPWSASSAAWPSRVGKASAGRTSPTRSSFSPRTKRWSRR